MAGFSSSKALSYSSLLVVFLLFSFSEAREFNIGGKNGSWAVPSTNGLKAPAFASATLSVKSPVQFPSGIFLFLMWKYDSAKDSVLRVTKEDYTNCNASNPIEQYKDDETKLHLDQPGPYYFISGTKGHCEKGQKLVVVVMTPRKHLGISPAPSPAGEVDGPAVAPTSGATSLQGGVLTLVALGVFAVWF
ncbi:early nodulin-like protein 1 [Pyrus ussuriensis x Pyrus communis]|uniref:Early nodulin-like protein 1 n=1 Tax=Pyrus ussuriensis x Pyrus communis TaxID=2448454 RepID=A0A5N5G3T6_9ROSA|nr:early nodulin-like protein 1 [Pyrus ussuriensis x Pyrus communis]